MTAAERILDSHRRAKAHRIKRGICQTAAAHGKATHGQLCEACRLKHRAADARRSARRGYQ